jgi:hypothetical protein
MRTASLLSSTVAKCCRPCAYTYTHILRVGKGATTKITDQSQGLQKSTSCVGKTIECAEIKNSRHTCGSLKKWHFRKRARECPYRHTCRQRTVVLAQSRQVHWATALWAVNGPALARHDVIRDLCQFSFQGTVGTLVLFTIVEHFHPLRDGQVSRTRKYTPDSGSRHANGTPPLLRTWGCSSRTLLRLG